MNFDGQDLLAWTAVATAAGWLLTRLRAGASQPGCAKCAAMPAAPERGRRSSRLRVL